MKTTKTKDWEDLNPIKEKLIDMVEEYFPKKRPNGTNKGRGEATVIVATAIVEFNNFRRHEREELIKDILPRLYELQSSIPLTLGRTARLRAKELINYLEALNIHD